MKATVRRRVSGEDTAALVARLAAEGIHLTVVDGQLHCRAALDSLSRDVCHDLATHGDALREWLRREAAPSGLVVRPAPKDLETPLAVPQERMWFLHQLAPASAAYTVAAALRLRGAVNRPSSNAPAGNW